MESLTLPANLDSLVPIAKFVLKVAQTANLDKKARYNLRLAVDEIATNIITHGYEEANLQGNIEIKAELTSEQLIIYLEDTGQEYDPAQREKIEKESLNLPLEEKPLGGLGVYLALESVDQFIYECQNGKNRNIFIMKLHQL